jgi:hypothetical protein
VTIVLCSGCSAAPEAQEPVGSAEIAISAVPNKEVGDRAVLGRNLTKLRPNRSLAFLITPIRDSDDRKQGQGGA